jgi:hypothetical protein
MATKIKSTKMLKREQVVPFDGEENFVVPKKGGFGQPDNENYVMVQSKDANFSYLTAPTTTGNTPPPPTTTIPQTIESGTTTSTTSPTQTQTTTTTTPPVETTPAPTTQVIPTPTTTTTITPIAETLPPEKSQAQIDCEAKGGTYTKSGCSLPALPTFPDWSTLDCATLSTQIASLQSTMATSRFANSTIADAYNTALATAQSTYATKCPITNTNVNVSVTTPTTTPIVSGGGIFGGGGGGGIGEPPTDEVPQTTEEAPKTSGKTWFVLLAIVGGLYFLTRKRG